MQTSSPAVGAVADSSKLPYAKDKIKEALIIAILNFLDSQAKNVVTTAYVHLANWQDGVGETDAETSISMLGGLDPDGDMDDLLNSVLAAGGDESPWQSMKVEEETQLLKEINDAQK